MTDTATKPWIRRKTTIAAFILIALVAWTLAAQSWSDKGCGTMQGYGLVVSHFGTPDLYEGCEDEPGGPAYTDDYDG
jgi:predicted small secreted protein